MKNKYKKNLLSIMIISIISLFLTKNTLLSFVISILPSDKYNKSILSLLFFFVSPVNLFVTAFLFITPSSVIP